MEPVYIVSAKRTPMGKFGRGLSSYSAPQLGALVIQAIMSEQGLPAEVVEEVVMGNVIQAGVGQNPAGQATSLAGLPDSVVRYTVNAVCASGMLAIESAFREISLGEKDCVIAGGMESMSRAPLLLPSSLRWGPKQLYGADYTVGDSMLTDGLLDGLNHEHMGEFVDATAKKLSISRQMADEYALQSFARAHKATVSGQFKSELVPVGTLSTDEGIRETTIESLATLKPAFTKGGVCTAGNSSQISDGASALLLASTKCVRERSLQPLARITGYSSSSLHPRDFAEAPVPATRKLLEKLGTKISSYDLVEQNEAYAVASIAVRDQLGIDNGSFNVSGGAVAMGHPLGSSGSRMVVSLLHALRSRKMTTGLATICHGGGGGYSLALEIL